MSYSDIRTKIETLFFTEFAIAEPNVSVSVENDNFEPANDPWVRISIRHAETVFASVSNSHERFSGQIFVQVFTRISEGTSTENRISDNVAAIFRGRNVDGIHYLNTSKNYSVVSDGWLQANLVTEFWTDVFY